MNPAEPDAVRRLGVIAGGGDLPRRVRPNDRPRADLGEAHHGAGPDIGMLADDDAGADNRVRADPRARADDRTLADPGAGGHAGIGRDVSAGMNAGVAERVLARAGEQRAGARKGRLGSRDGDEAHAARGKRLADIGVDKARRQVRRLKARELLGVGEKANHARRRPRCRT